MKKVVNLKTTEFINSVNEYREEVGKSLLTTEEAKALLRWKRDGEYAIIEGWYSPSGEGVTWHTYKRSSATMQMQMLYGRYIQHLHSGKSHRLTEAGAFARKEAKRLSIQEAAEQLLDN